MAANYTLSGASLLHFLAREKKLSMPLEVSGAALALLGGEQQTPRVTKGRTTFT